MLTARYLGKGGGYGLGPGGQCICPACGMTITHQTGTQCYLINCPKCGSKMTRMISAFQGLSAATMPPPPPSEGITQDNTQTLTPETPPLRRRFITNHNHTGIAEKTNGEGKKNGGNGKEEENGKMPTWAWVAIAAGAMFLLMER